MSEKNDRSTEFSECRKYRYTLWRDWDFSDLCGGRNGTYLMVIGLNPSTADETKDDPTIRKCIGFAKRWGFGALCMTNLFAWRDTKPDNMKKAVEPQGYHNDEWLFKMAMGAGMILAAWGKDGSYRNRSREVLDALAIYGREVHALKINKDGSPMHPLYVPYAAQPIHFPPISHPAK